MERFGKYEILEKIGEGGFGVIYKGYDPLIKRTVAIKTCTTQDREIRDRFFQEAQIAGNLQHRNITIVFDFGIQNDIPYLIQEYLSGEDLHRKIRRGDHIPFGTKLLYLIQVARGLQHAHRFGIVHRDVKPNNIRVLEDNTVKIMDFGIAKMQATNQSLTQTGETLGTASYLSPEQIRGEPLDQRADIFSLGVLAYELITGKRAFDGDNPSTVLYQVLGSEPRPIDELARTCPPEMKRIVERCMKKSPDERYADCGELLSDLGGLIETSEEEAASGSIIAPPSSDSFSFAAHRELEPSIHTGATMPLTPRSMRLDRVELDSALNGDVGVATSDHGRSRTLGALLLLLVITGLGAGGWWYFQGYRANWETSDADTADRGPVSASPVLIRSSPTPTTASDPRAQSGARPNLEVPAATTSTGPPLPTGPTATERSSGSEEAAAADLEGRGTSSPLTDPAETTANLLEPNEDETGAPPNLSTEPTEPDEAAPVQPTSDGSPARASSEEATEVATTPSTTSPIERQDASNAASEQVAAASPEPRQPAPPAAIAHLTVRQSPGSRPVWVVADGRALGWTPLQGRVMAPGAYEISLFASAEGGEPLHREPVTLREGHVRILTYDSRRQVLSIAEKASPGLQFRDPSASGGSFDS